MRVSPESVNSDAHLGTKRGMVISIASDMRVSRAAPARMGGTALAWNRFRAKREKLEAFLPESLGQNLVLAVLFVTISLDSGLTIATIGGELHSDRGFQVSAIGRELHAEP